MAILQKGNYKDKHGRAERRSPKARNKTEVTQNREDQIEMEMAGHIWKI